MLIQLYRFCSSRNIQPARKIVKGDDIFQADRFRPQHVTLELFDVPIPQAFQDRFDDLKTLLQLPLKEHLEEHLSKIKCNPGPHCWSLWMLGHEKATARPYFVLTCHRRLGKAVRSFLLKASVRCHFQLETEDAERPSLSVIVRPSPDRLLQMSYSEWVVRVASKHAQPCRGSFVPEGFMLSVGHDACREASFATAGGIIKLMRQDSSYELCILTAGHVFHGKCELDIETVDDLGYHRKPTLEGSNALGGQGNVSEDSDNSSWDSEGENPSAQHQQARNLSRTHLWSESQLCDPLGTLRKASWQSAQESPDLDWALVECSAYIDNNWKNLGSNIATIAMAPKYEGSGLFGVSQHPHAATAFVWTGSNGRVDGWLSSGHSYFSVSTGSLPAKVKTFIPSNGNLKHGDSGSWIVESSTGKVHGHLIAVNSFGEGYVVLLDEILHDIPKVLRDMTVSATIATENDLRQYRWRKIAEGDNSDDHNQDKALDICPISLESSPSRLAMQAFQSSVKLYRMVQGFQNRPKLVRDLEEELEALCTVLETLYESVRVTDDRICSALRLPLLRCSKACEEFGNEITKWSSGVRDTQNFRDWARLRYLGDDMNDFRQLLSAYKSTFIVSLIHANIRKPVVSIDCLQECRDFMGRAKNDLEAHFHHIEEKIKTLLNTFTGSGSHSDIGLAELGVETMENYTNNLSLPAPNLKSTSIPLRDLLLDRLSMDNVKESDVDLERLLKELENTSRCMEICSSANLYLKEELGVTENYTAGDVVQFLVSNNGKILHGRSRDVGWRSGQIGGHLRDASIRKLLESPLNVDFQTTKISPQTLRGNTSLTPVDGMESSFTKR